MANHNITLFPSAARAVAQAYASDDQQNLESSGGHIIINVTAITASPSVVFKIQGRVPDTGTTALYYDILVSAAIVGTGVTVLKVFPGFPVTANVSVNDILPRTWRVIATHGDTDSITYSVTASLVE